MGRKHKHKPVPRPKPIIIKNVEKKKIRLDVSEKTEKELRDLLNEKAVLSDSLNQNRYQEIRKSSSLSRIGKCNSIYFKYPKSFSKVIAELAKQFEIYDDMARIFGFYLDTGCYKKKARHC